MPKKVVQMPIENEILKFLQARFACEGGSLKKGIGDDAAVIRPGKAGEYWLVTTDMLVEDVDFRREWSSPRQLGRKSISVNLSDIAAMGARPRFFTVSLGLPGELSKSWITAFYDGLTEKGNAQGAILVGGDLSSSRNGILISVTVLGESVKRKVVYRSGGREGDILYVTGTLGRSAAGLRLLQEGRVPAKDRAQREAIRAHLQPEARCEAGVWLGSCGMVRCMMDISDGLSADLPRLCAASDTAAEIDARALPLFHPAGAWGWDPVDLALHGGEDFELLFAVAKTRSAVFEKNYPRDLPPATRIGTMIRGKGGVWIRNGSSNRRRLKNLGYDHFSRTS